MKKEQGITMISLVVYVAVMTLVIVIMNSIIINFYNNTDAVQADIQDIVEFNKFNSYFLKEIKTANNKVDQISNDNQYILFSTGNFFSISDNNIYYNKIKICENVESMQISLGKNGNGIDKSIVNITLNFKNFNKSISYKIENIY